MKYEISKVTKVLVAGLVLVFALGFLAPSSKVDASEATGMLTQKNESVFHLKLNEGIKGKIDEKGQLTISDKDGKAEKLPVEAKDKNGDKVNLVYKKVTDGYDIQVVKNEEGTTFYKTNWAKCALGTVGGTGTGTLGGGAAGSVIPVIGTGAGMIIGGVSGAATGAAASCFD
ncbi:hypothetical protein GWD55_09635 [Staphylococcus pseudintermedius]|nr:hypothetical protein [Staphylococcus pseudintermedius]